MVNLPRNSTLTLPAASPVRVGCAEAPSASVANDGSQLPFTTSYNPLLGADAALCDNHTRYRCHDRLLEHKRAVFDHLTDRWRDLFNVSFDVLLYDLTSTYFECDPPQADDAKRRFGHSRDRRSDRVQVVIALVVTPEGLPLAYEVLAGNTADNTTLRHFLAQIEGQYGRARRRRSRTRCVAGIRRVNTE